MKRRRPSTPGSRSTRGRADGGVPVVTPCATPSPALEPGPRFGAAGKRCTCWLRSGAPLFWGPDQVRADKVGSGLSCLVARSDPMAPRSRDLEIPAVATLRRDDVLVCRHPGSTGRSRPGSVQVHVSGASSFAASPDLIRGPCPSPVQPQDCRPIRTLQPLREWILNQVQDCNGELDPQSRACSGAEFLNPVVVQAT